MLLLQLGSLPKDIENQRYVKMALEWIPQAISLGCILTEFCFKIEASNLLALSMTFSQTLTLLNLGGTTNEASGRFLHLFSQAIQLFIMAVILVNSIKTKYIRIFVNVLIMLSMSVGSVLGVENTELQWESVSLTLSENRAYVVILFLVLCFN